MSHIDLVLRTTEHNGMRICIKNNCYFPLFENLIKNLEFEQLKEMITSYEISRCFKFVSVDESDDTQCICGHLINTIYWFKNTLSGKLVKIGSKCKDHWFKDDEDIRKESLPEIKRQLFNKKREQLIKEGIPHCRECLVNTTIRKCRQCELVQVKIPNRMRMIIKATFYASKNKIYLEYNPKENKWYCHRKNSKLFEIYDSEGSDIYFFDIDPNEYEILT